MLTVKDILGLLHQSQEGARIGFTGKQIIHPSQIEKVQTAFTPSDEKIQWAQNLLRAYDEYQEKGQGAFSFHGAMIDMPLVLQAKNILETIRLNDNAT